MEVMDENDPPEEVVGVGIGTPPTNQTSILKTPGPSNIGPESIPDPSLNLNPAEIALMVEWLRSSKSEEASAVRSEINYLLKKLDYLNGSHASIIFTALEELARDWEVLHRDLARMEGLLARTDLEAADPHILKSCRTAILNFRKVSRRVDGVANMAIVIECVSARAEYLNKLLSGESYEDQLPQDNNQQEEDQSQPELSADNSESTFPLTHQFQKINREIMRRMDKWTTELDRRLEGVMAI